MTKLVQMSPRAIVIHCGDPRFQAAFREFLASKALAEGFYIPLIIPGSIGNLVLSLRPKHVKVITEQLNLYLHRYPNIRIIVINHEDCKAYAATVEKFRAFIPVTVFQKQKADLTLGAKAIAAIAKQHGGTPTVELYMARIKEGEEIVFERVEEAP